MLLYMNGGGIEVTLEYLIIYMKIEDDDDDGVVRDGTKMQGEVKEGNKKKETSLMKRGKCKSEFLANL